MQRLLIILLFTGLIINSSKGQDNLFTWDYYSYLKFNGLFREAVTWLDNYPDKDRDEETNNLILSEKAGLQVKMGKIDSANYYYRKCNLTYDSATLYNAVFIAFIAKDTCGIRHYLSKYSILSENPEILLSYNLMLGKLPENNSLIVGNDILFKIANDMKNYKHKSPALSAIFSLMIPGLGKLYSGNYNQAKSAFATNMAFILTGTESLLLNAPNAYTGFCLLVTSVFYTGNVWGSAAYTLKREKDFYNQIHEDISYYYYSRFYH